MPLIRKSIHYTSPTASMASAGILVFVMLLVKTVCWMVNRFWCSILLQLALLDIFMFCIQERRWWLWGGLLSQRWEQKKNFSYKISKTYNTDRAGNVQCKTSKAPTENVKMCWQISGRRPARQGKLKKQNCQEGERTKRHVDNVGWTVRARKQRVFQEVKNIS